MKLNKTPTLEGFAVEDTLGTGKMATDVRKAVDINSQQEVAIKFQPSLPGRTSTLDQERKVLSELTHPNIAKYISHGCCCTDNNETNYLVLELCKNGDLFTKLKDNGSFSEELCRFYAIQLLNCLEYLHSRNIAHRDIKPENILLTEQFELKLCDFDMAVKIAPGSTIQEIAGTRLYMAPEVWAKEEYNPMKADIFSLGALLFTMVAGVPPIRVSPNKSDSFYRYLMMGKPMYFWRIVERVIFKNKEFTLSEELQDLLQSMLQPLPECRPSLESIKNHPWFSNSLEALSLKEVQRKMKERNSQT